MARTLEERWDNPIYEIVVELGFKDGCLQIGYLEHRGRSEWRTKRVAEKHAREYTEMHGRVAYVQEF